MMRILVITLVLALTSGCATVREVGDVEGLGEVGEVIRAVDSSIVVLGGTPARRDTASVVNRTVGEARQIEDKESIPSIIQSGKYILQNVGSLLD